MKENELRLDIAMVEQKLAPSRERAKALISSGLVRVNGEKQEKSSYIIKNEDIITLKGKDIPYVSRGGLKLEKALNQFPIALNGQICCDIGASTGGFTDCMLQNGAKKVYAIDVGYGQLAWKLRQDERVINLERTNIRNVTNKEVPDLIAFASVDVSFISLYHIFPVLWQLLEDDGEAVTLVKPQFEAGREKVGKKGVVREPSIHLEVLEKVSKQVALEKFCLKDVTFSPVRGPEGNIEYLFYLQKQKFLEEPIDQSFLKKVVEESHKDL